MGIFDGVLLCTDLDGTLFRNDKSISAENAAAIEYFKREGGSFTFITGRMPFCSQSAYRMVRPNVPFGCINGAGLYDGAPGEYVYKMGVDREACELIRLVDKQFPNVGIRISAFYKTYFYKDSETMVRFRRSSDLPYYKYDTADIGDDVGKIVFGSEYDEEILGIKKLLTEHPLADKFTFMRTEKTLFEILPRGTNKGIALSRLGEHLGIDKSKTVAVGDYYNDVEMIRAAGVGVAVSNACKEVLDAASHITVSNEEHAIAQIIRDIESGKLL